MPTRGVVLKGRDLVQSHTQVSIHLEKEEDDEGSGERRNCKERSDLRESQLVIEREYGSH